MKSSSRARTFAPPFVVTAVLGVACEATVNGGGDEGDPDETSTGSGTGTTTGSMTTTDTGVATMTGMGTETATYTNTLTGINDPNCPAEPPEKGSPCGVEALNCVYEDIACGHYPSLDSARAQCYPGEVWRYSIYTGTGTGFGNPPAPCPCFPPDETDICGVPSLSGDQELPCQYDECLVYGECDGSDFVPVPSEDPNCL